MDLCYPTMGFYRKFTFLLLYSSLFGSINGQTSNNKPGSCHEAHHLGSTNSGEKILYTASGRQFKMYCHFGAGRIYGLLHKDIFSDNAGIDLDVTKLYDCMKEARIGFFDSNYNLYEVRVGRLDHTSSEKRPVILWTEHNNFVAPDTTDKNYLFLGFYEEHEAGQPGAVRGIQIVNENKNCSFTVGGQRGKRYIAFYGETVSDEFPYEGIYPCVGQGREASKINAPAEGYSLFTSFQFSGGGAHMTTDQMADYNGMNFIFTYDYG